MKQKYTYNYKERKYRGAINIFVKITSCLKNFNLTIFMNENILCSLKLYTKIKAWKIKFKYECSIDNMQGKRKLSECHRRFFN